MTDQNPAANPAQGTAAPQVSADNATDEGTANAQAASEQDDADSTEGEGQQKKPAAQDSEKRQSRLDRKIGKLTYQANQTARENAELRKQIDELNKRTAPQAAPKPVRASFETEDDFIEALTDWKLDTKLAERDKANPKPSQNNGQAPNIGVSKDDWEKRETAFADKTADYEDALEDFNPPRTLTGGAVSHAILKHEKGPELIYHLAKNPDEADILFALPPERATAKLQRIADGLGKSTTAAPKQQLPDPPTSLKGGNATTDESKLSGKDLLKKYKVR